MARIPDEQREVALDLIYDRRREGYDPLQKLHGAVRGRRGRVGARAAGRGAAALPLFERLKRRIVDGERNGLEADLDAAMRRAPPLDIINDDPARRA